MNAPLAQSIEMDCFVGSRFCLMEVVMIVPCSKAFGQLLPLFYGPTLKIATFKCECLTDKRTLKNGDTKIAT